MPPAETVPTRILIISDTHTAPLIPPAPPTTSPDIDDDEDPEYDQPFRAPLPSADVLLHCGDITMMGHLDEYARALDMLGQIDAPLKLVIAGNHDLSLDADFYLRKSRGEARWTNGQRMHLKDYDPDLPRKAREMWTGEPARARGVTYLEEGVHDFVLQNGARLRVYASPWQPEFWQWAFNYDHREDRWNPPHLAAKDAARPTSASTPLPETTTTTTTTTTTPPPIDVVMTHGPPKGILDATAHGPVGCPHLLRAVARVRPRLHAWGHIHEAWGVERVAWAEQQQQQQQQQSASTDRPWALTRRADFVGSAERLVFEAADVARRHGAFVDASSAGAAPLRAGRETLMVNASIMDLHYHPTNAPVVVDLDLVKADG